MNERRPDRIVKYWLARCAGILIALMAAMPLTAAPGEVKTTPLEIVLVEPEAVTAAAVSQWKKEGFKAVAVVLDERASEAAYRTVSRQISEGGLDLYCCSEVGRN